jgi:hypothetical protein
MRSVPAQGWGRPVYGNRGRRHGYSNRAGAWKGWRPVLLAARQA